MQSILVVEDDRNVGEAVQLTLERAGLEVTLAVDGADGLRRALDGNHDLLVLDLMLPTVDGLEICREVRRSSQLPIVILSARSDTSDVVEGLELGADDYLTKPFKPRELVARVRAALRRTVLEPGAGELVVGDLRVDLEGHRAWIQGAVIPLSSTEFKLLGALLRNRGRVLTREVLLSMVWGYDYLGDSRLVDMAVKRLRDKLGDDPRSPRYITTVRGAGYRLDGG